MKLQHLSIIFVIIILPIALIMTKYLQTQIDTITLQTKYKTALDDASYAGLEAFQINTLNNKYSSISDSKVRDVEAAINTFYSSLGTSMDIYLSSKEALQNFVPAVLFNLYDGYYIYSSYANTYGTIGTGDDQMVEIDESIRSFQKGLHPYIYYSCKYKLNNGNIVVVNYTLDNAITIYGDLGNGEGYQTRSGYLIDVSKISNINERSKTLTYDGVQIGPETLKEHLLIVEGNNVVPGDYEYIIYKNQKVYKDRKQILLV